MFGNTRGTAPFSTSLHPTGNAVGERPGLVKRPKPVAAALVPVDLIILRLIHIRLCMT